MAGYRGYDRGSGYYQPSVRGNQPGGMGRGRGHPGFGYDRPWTGGAYQDFQGGSIGMRTGTTPDSRAYRDADLWWSGNRGRGEYAGSPYDRQYREFDQRNHPRYSPVGGMNMGMGGAYRYGGVPRPLAYDRWFSDWTRWF